MNDNEIIEACAKLDGWIHHFDIIHGEITDEQVDGWHNESGEEISKLPNYLKSRDAIIPLIQKQPKEVLQSIKDFFCISFCPTTNFIAVIHATPALLCEALLGATNNWKD